MGIAASIPILTIVSFVRDTGKFIWILVDGEDGYLTNYKENAEALRLESEILESLAKDVQTAVDTAQNKGEIIKCEVNNWIKRKDEITAKIQKDSSSSRWCRCCSGSDGWCQNYYKLGKRAVKKKKEILALIEDGRFDCVAHRLNSPTIIPAPRDFQLFESTRVSKQALMAAIHEEEVDFLGLYGIEGAGKTYVVKELAAEVQEVGLFDQVLMAMVSSSPNIRAIQGQLADCLGLRLEAESEQGRAERLQARLLRCKNMVFLILDSVCEYLDLSEVGIPQEQRKCKILVTTRSKSVCSAMGCQRAIHLDVLSENDSLELFKKAAGLVSESQEFDDAAKMIARACGGVPGRLVTVGRSLGDKDLRLWRREAQRLSRSSSPTGVDGAIEQLTELSLPR